jgi:predicted transglutaminase-like cysteine proteinase
MFKLGLVSFVLALLVGCSSSPKVEQGNQIQAATQARVEAWQELIQSGQQWPDMKKLNAVNNFINGFDFVDDIYHWGKQDYWATPLQTIVTKGGDCEDLAIAKYFSLTEMGMEEDKLRLTYVKALELNQAHMVVSYYPQPRVEPLVLDNLNPVILPASQRPDLLPAYSFNGSGLWLTKKNQAGQLVDDAGRLSLWQGLLRSMDVEAADENKMICLYQYYDLPKSVAKTKCD